MRDTRGAKYMHRERHAKPARKVTLRVWTDREKTLAAVALVLRDLGVNLRNVENIIRLANLKIDSGDVEVEMALQHKLYEEGGENA